MDLEKDADFLVQSLAKVLELRRQNLHISQEELARRAGISRTYLSDIERGLRNISVATLHKLSEAMGTDASAMLAEAEKAADGDGRDGHRAETPQSSRTSR